VLLPDVVEIIFGMNDPFKEVATLGVPRGKLATELIGVVGGGL
jgi:hypothetical protein